VEYRRNLPHFQPEGAALFITFRLYGTLPMVSGRDGERVRNLYELGAFVVMPNHVHLLIEPKTHAPKITQYVKGVSARQANALLCRTGHPFWQDESFDRWVRSSRERSNIIRYIEFNPVRANLVQEPQLFRFSSAFYSNEQRTG
jgi:REP element-mobilizing transposase RayT